MNINVNMKVTYGLDAIELWRLALNTDLKIVSIEDVMSQKNDTKKRIGYTVIATPKDEEELTDLLNFCQNAACKIQVIVTREVPAAA